MEQDVEIEAVSGISGSLEQMQLTDVVSESSRNAGVEEAMSVVVSDALENASSRPGHGADRLGPGEAMTNAFGGEFGAQKEELLSDVVRPGAETSLAPETSEVEQVSEALAGLMHDLTTWHITWGVAQTAQKDLTHVLKSS